MTQAPRISPESTQEWLADGQEVALLDVREAGQFGEGHPFFAIPLPYSRLEIDIAHLVPRKDTRTVLVDAGDCVAEKAGQRLARLGYSHVHVLEGGAPGWQRAGFTLFKGVNLPSKTFGELVEHAYDTPHVSAQELQARLDANEPLVLLDGRTAQEHQKMAIPGAVSVPNGELALRWRSLVPDAATPIVVHCAGRTRSIIGAQILRSLGVPNPVLALENGTQGWALAGLTLEHGSTRSGVQQPVAAHAGDQAAARGLAQEAGVHLLSVPQAQAWLDDSARTTYVLDVRTAGEFAAGTLTGARHAPGGQLLQATDQSIGVRAARVLLLDDDGVRAPVVAAWLARLGHETAVVEGGIGAALRVPAPVQHLAALPSVPEVASEQLAQWVAQQQPVLLDLQPSLAHRQQHPAGARWTVRPRIVATLQSAAAAPEAPVLLLAPDAATAQLAAVDLAEAGWRHVHWTSHAQWSGAGLAHQTSPLSPGDGEAIDYLFFVHDRHDGNLDAARRYLEWETGLIAQCSPQELGTFRLPQREPVHA
ncbi:MAG: rhodanese-like domain-containing protein [Pseudomonadota bacterium]